MEARVQNRPPLLHRTGERVFITTEDPNYRYEWGCAHCDYPITPHEPCCPRCQRALEECPVCSCQRHVLVPCVQPDAQGARLCPACGVRRLPFGDEALKDIEARFCTNLYGCPAGGLLLRTDEFALLPADTSLCPVCRDESFPPLPVITFAYHVEHCLFCSTLYQARATWKARWGQEPDLIGELGQTTGPLLADCVLCGRQDTGEVERPAESEGSKAPSTDQPMGDRKTVFAHVSPGPPEERAEPPLRATRSEYLHMAELARILMLEPVMNRAFQRLFKAWFGAEGSDGAGDAGPNIGRIVEALIRGTRREPHRKVLQRRLTELLDRLGRHFPRGASFPLRPVGPRRGYLGVHR